MSTPTMHVRGPRRVHNGWATSYHVVDADGHQAAWGRCRRPENDRAFVDAWLTEATERAHLNHPGLVVETTEADT